MGLTTLPLPYLYHSVTTVHLGKHGLALCHGVGNRLFTIHILAGINGIGKLKTVPMVRGANNDHIDIGILQ